MSDIAYRLRAQRDHADDWRTMLSEEAADEIDRLNAQTLSLVREISTLRADNERLRGLLLRSDMALYVNASPSNATVAALRDDIRATLGTQADQPDVTECPLCHSRKIAETCDDCGHVWERGENRVTVKSPATTAP